MASRSPNLAAGAIEEDPLLGLEGPPSKESHRQRGLRYAATCAIVAMAVIALAGLQPARRHRPSEPAAPQLGVINLVAARQGQVADGDDEPQDWVHCTGHANSDFKGHDVESKEFDDVEDAIAYAGKFGYKGFAFKEGVAYMKWSAGSAALAAQDLHALDASSGVTFYLCDGAYLATTRITTTTEPTTTTPPPTTTQPPVVVDVVNGRFVSGDAHAGTTQAGILIHQWDNMEGTGHDMMWTPCQADWCRAFSDRFSTSLINAKSPKQKGGKLGLFSDELGGFIINPTVAKVLCSYPSDGGTMSKKCSDDGSPTNDGCVPGCEKKQCSADMWWTCSFPPNQMGTMFDKYVENQQKYNEVVVSTAGWDPKTSIEAFFYVAAKKGGCGNCDKGCIKTRDQHNKYLATFQMQASQVPLLCLDQSKWDYPFSDMSGQV